MASQPRLVFGDNRIMENLGPGDTIGPRVIDQAFGDSWAFYNGDCVFVMAGLPADSIDFQVESPPFSKLYIYSDHIADQGNSSDDAEFFEGYQFTLRGQYRIAKPGSYHAIHCKDLMRYMSSHDYAGQDDFSGKIILAAEAEGWVFQRRITIWKNPVVEMQRTKTYGLLHKSFATRAEVVRVGAPDYVLIFRKQDEPGHYDESWPMPELPRAVIDRVAHIWTMASEDLSKVLYVGNDPLSHYTDVFIGDLSKQIGPGRLAFIRCVGIPRLNGNEVVGAFDMAGEIIRRFEGQGSWRFHTRITLTDGSYLVGFRNWTLELKENYQELNGRVTHDLRAPRIERYEYQNDKGEFMHYDRNNVPHPDYVGTDPPLNWHDDDYYSILVWQKYASPVWCDLDGLPGTSEDAWMNIKQTDVLNKLAAKDPEDDKHICPLQLDLIRLLIEEYSEPGEIVFSPYGGISSEGHEAVKLGRKAILAELKRGYWTQGVKYLRGIEIAIQQMSML